MTTTEAPHFTRVIRAQIGVGTLMAVGATDFLYSDKDGERFLRFKVTGKRGYWTAVQVTLDPSDTYTVSLTRMHKKTFEFETVQSLELVYADQLAEVIRRMCGE